MDATSCLARHIESWNDLTTLVEALSIHRAFQATHTVMNDLSLVSSFLLGCIPRNLRDWDVNAVGLHYVTSSGPHHDNSIVAVVGGFVVLDFACGSLGLGLLF